MGDARLARQRRDRTARDLCRAAADVGAWHAELTSDPGKTSKRRHQSQIDTLSRVLKAGIAQLKHLLGETAVGDDAGAVWAACAEVDRRLSFLQAVHDYYAERLRQREQRDAWALDAADDLVWSCYLNCFTGTTPPRPPPLTFFHADTAPWVLEHDKPLGATGVDTMLDRNDNVPVRLLAVPRWMAREPWSIVLLIHELGHHVLREERARIDAIEALVEVSAAGPRRPVWRGWAEEIFADLFAVSAAGADFIAALAQIVRGPVARLSSSSAKYPSAIVRLHLAVAFLQKRGGHPPALAGLTWTDTKALVDPAEHANLEADLAIAEQVATCAQDDTVLKPLWLPPVDAAIVAQRVATGAGVGQNVQSGRDEPRLWASVVHRRWLDPTSPVPDDASRDGRVKNDLVLLTLSAPGGTRAGTRTPDANRLAAALLDIASGQEPVP